MNVAAASTKKPQPDGSQIISDRAPLIALGALVVITTATVFVARFSGAGLQTRTPQEVVETLTLKVADGDSGSVRIIDAESGALIWTYSPGEAGFARTALRSLAFRREIEGLGPEQPIRLHRTAAGRLILEDPATSERIEVNAFGKSNVDQFAPVAAAFKTAGTSQ
ncbi:MAG: photosynthetic complex assembly protein PuhC [Alphaproteobacteria bacterium]|nr:photosynthetic complex assembly protein PuhC [Alphaproteobacteria bacterium]